MINYGMMVGIVVYVVAYTLIWKENYLLKTVPTGIVQVCRPHLFTMRGSCICIVVRASAFITIVPLAALPNGCW